jgi:hypothetical protein
MNHRAILDSAAIGRIPQICVLTLIMNIHIGAKLDRPV